MRSEPRYIAPAEPQLSEAERSRDAPSGVELSYFIRIHKSITISDKRSSNFIIYAVN